MWKRESSKLCYSHPYLKVFEDEVIIPNGEKILFSRLDLNDFVTIIPMDSKKMIMLLNYRYPTNRWSFELPSGLVEKDEAPKECAERELQEETGYKGDFTYLTWYYPISRSNQKAHLFLATDLIKGSPKRDQTENQQIKVIPKTEVFDRLDNGEIKHAPTIIALNVYRNLLSREL